MRAVTFRAGQRVELEAWDDPRPGAGEALLRIRASGICHTDLEILKGNYGAGAFPLVPGHEFAGEVVALGEGVEGISLGEAVVVDPNLGCGSCKGCRAGRVNLCERLGAYGVSTHGGFAEYCVVRAEKLYPIGDLSFHTAALAEPLGCVLNGLSPLEGRRLDRSLVFGAGPIGMLMAIALGRKGAESVTVIEPDAARRDMAESFGLKAFSPDAAQLKDYLGTCDVAVDATGLAAVAAGLTSYLANGGAGLFFGVCPQSARIEVSPFEMFRRQLSLFGTHSLNLGHIPAALKLLAEVGPSIERLVTHRMSLEEITETFKSHAPKGAMKVHLTA